MLKKFSKKLTVLSAALVLTFGSFAFTSCETSKVSVSEKSTLLEPDSQVKRNVLSNGMSYYIMNNKEPKNRIVLRLAVKTGSCMEDDDQLGIAHLIEHMCFNGTENFQKSEIVDYFERIGMNFGADLNAYTSFEETVYMLEVPADDPQMLKTALSILKDMATAVTFDRAEVEKERGVVTEEWRLSQGLQTKLNNLYLNSLYKDSVYPDRLPIGTENSIKNTPYERIVDYYKKWYRPEFMSVIAVGDVKTDVLEKEIKEIMGTIPASKDSLVHPEFKVPFNSEKNLSILKDAEQKYPVIQIFNRRKENNIQKTVEDLKENIAFQIAATAMNQRFSEITMAQDAPWLDAGVSELGYTNNTLFNFIGFVPKTGLTVESFKKILDEYDRFMAFGATETEVERIKASMLSTYDQAYKNKDLVTSAAKAEKLIAEYLTGKPVIAEDYNNKLLHTIIPQLTADDVSDAARKYLADRGTNMLIMAPESEKLPSQKELMDVWKNYKSQEIQAYTENVSSDDFMKRPATKAKISSTKKIKELGVTEYILENGVKIITKHTTEQKNTINMVASSKGGTYLLAEEDVPSALLSLNYRYYSGFGGLSLPEFSKKMSGKNVSFDFNLNQTSESISGNTSQEDLELLMQLTNKMFTERQFTDEGWNQVVQAVNIYAQSHGSQPNEVFIDKIREIIYGKTLYHSAITPEFASKLDQKKAERIFAERFADPSDFTFVFVGDFTEKTLLEQCCYYLGTIPTDSKNKEETKYINFPFPKGKPSATVKKGNENKGTVYVGFGGSLPASDDINKKYEEAAILEQLSGLLNIRLREVIREDMSGSYGVGVSAKINGYPERFYNVEISFGCEPERQQELTDAVIKVIKEIQTTEVSEENLLKLKETYVRSREQAESKNSWWMDRINAELVFTYEPLNMTSDAKYVPSLITSENLKNAANKYLNTDNFVTVFLKPEL